MLSDLCFLLGALCVLGGVVSAVAVTAALERRNIKVNWLFMRVLIFKYLGMYRDVTLKEKGRIGPFFYTYVLGMNLALVFVILGLALR